MVEDLGAPTPAAIARALQVSERTCRRWMASGKAPRTAALSLFWLTRWGQSIVDADAVNAARLQAGHARSLAEHVQRLERHVERLLRLGDWGAANAPMWDDPGTRAAAAVRPAGRSKHRENVGASQPSSWAGPAAPPPLQVNEKRRAAINTADQERLHRPARHRTAAKCYGRTPWKWQRSSRSSARSR